jgi:hypothetical protein
MFWLVYIIIWLHNCAIFYQAVADCINTTRSNEVAVTELQGWWKTGMILSGIIYGPLECSDAFYRRILV